jgi:hypothetical protein
MPNKSTKKTLSRSQKESNYARNNSKRDESRVYKPSKKNPSGSPFGRFSLLNQVIKGVDKLTGHKRKYPK